MRLALLAGELNVDALAARMPGHQFAEWMAFYTCDPFGEQRADARMARLQAQIANMFSRKRVDAEAFMPRYGPVAPQSREAIVSILSMAASAAAGGRRNADNQ